MKKVLIIGGTGSTGLYITKHLSEIGTEVVVTGFKDRDLKFYRERGIEYYSLDISIKEEFSKLPVDVDCVVLLAGMMPARMNGYDPHKYININTLGTLNTLEFCRLNNIKKIIYAQSHSDVYGHWNTGEYISNNATRLLNYRGDHAVYIISKCAAVDLIEHYHQDYGIQSIVFRLPTIYCYWPDNKMYVDGNKKTMAYLVFIEKAINGETIEIWGDPTVSKDIVYVKDFVQLVEKAIHSKKAQGIYNVGSGIPTTLEEQIKGVIEIFSEKGNQSQIIFRPEMGSQTSYLYDISKTIRDLGYRVNYKYMDMLRDMKVEMNNPWFVNIQD